MIGSGRRRPGEEGEGHSVSFGLSVPYLTGILLQILGESAGICYGDFMYESATDGGTEVFFQFDNVPPGNISSFIANYKVLFV